MAKKPPTRAHRKRDLHRLVVARSDITAALNACRLLIAEVKAVGDDLYRPLLDAIVVSYSRPFTANKPLGSLPAKWSKFSDPRHQHVHDQILKMRHKFVAHSDPYERSVYIVPPYVPIPGAGTHFVDVGVAVRTTAFEVGHFPDIERTCLDLGSRLNAAVDPLLKELYGSRVLPGAQFQLTIDDGL